ncbi:MAG TPA: hypothetical protein VFZ49_03385 [Pyrinomonadaceae bacterium]
MKIARKIVLVFLAVLVAVQAPFVYRRYKIGRLADRIEAVSAQRVSRETPGYTEYKGVMHVHTFLGGHSSGTFEELINAANANDLDFVVMTEHTDRLYDTSALTLNGTYGQPLFINGQEVDTNDGGRFLLLPGSAESLSFSKLDSKTFLDKVHSEGRIAMNNYPDRNRSGVAGFDGIEVYSTHINLKRANLFTAIGDILWSYPAYPEVTIATYLRPLRDYVETYDRIASQQRLLLTAGVDAHSNKGYYLIADDEGNRHIGFKLDPYETAFRIVRMHVLLESGIPLTRESVIEALRRGHAFVGFDVLGDTSAFQFMAENGAERRIMGDEIASQGGVKVSATTPSASRMVVLRNGVKIAEFPDVTEMSINISETGTYRVEAYLDQLGEPFDRTPWIMSNPIYVR